MPRAEDQQIGGFRWLKNRARPTAKELLSVQIRAMLSYVHQLNAETIASLTDTPVKTVYTRLSRGLEILKKRYFEEEQKTEKGSEEEKSKGGKQ